jgi:hypothetical protein
MFGIFIVFSISVEWNNLAQVRDKQRDLLNEVMKSKVLQNAGDILTAGRTIIFWRRNLLHGVI